MWSSFAPSPQASNQRPMLQTTWSEEHSVLIFRPRMRSTTFGLDHGTFAECDSLDKYLFFQGRRIGLIEIPATLCNLLVLGSSPGLPTRPLTIGALIPLTVKIGLVTDRGPSWEG